ncbi:MAG: hypothetical protein ACE5K8_06610 [Candidatus Zixiibacteriota bacterium]
MNILLVTSWLCLPIFPLNPTEQDTLPPMNLHFTIGLSGPNGFTQAGPEVTAKYEVLLVHPVVAQLAFDYRFGKAKSKMYPTGNLHGATISLVALYYRGTNKITGYIGAGAVYTLHHFQLSDGSADSLLRNERISKVSLSRTFGYRIILGLRFHRSFSLEIGVTEVKPKLVFTERLSQNSYAVFGERVRLSDVRVTVGYLLTIMK